MYRINLGNNKIKYLTGGALLLGAFVSVFMISIVAMPVIKLKNNTDSFVMSSRIEIATSRSESTTYYTPKYYFNVGEIEYSCSTDISQSYKPSLEPTKIFYNSKNPSECVSDPNYNRAAIMLFGAALVAIIDILIALFLIIPAARKSANAKKLTQYGQLIKNIPCKIVHSFFTLNGVKGYNIEIKYEVSEGNVLYLKSDMKFNNDFKGRETADLLIDPMNQKNYFIDFDIT